MVNCIKKYIYCRVPWTPGSDDCGAAVKLMWRPGLQVTNYGLASNLLDWVTAGPAGMLLANKYSCNVK